MKTYLFTPCSLAAVLCFTALSTGGAQTIYSDSFTTGTNGVSLSGRTPEVTLTGANFVNRTRGQVLSSFNTTVGNTAGSANTNANGAAALSLSTGGSFTRVANASIFTISADLSVGTLTGSGTADLNTSTRGVSLGFYTSAFGAGSPGNDANGGFTGFALQQSVANTSNGLLQFVQNGTSVGEANLAVLTGTLSTTAFYNLAYTVDTSTGNLLSATFNGADIFSSFSTTAAGAFTDAATAFAGFGGSSSTGSRSGNVDNFSLLVVPEPSSAALALIGGAGMMLNRRRLQRMA